MENEGQREELRFPPIFQKFSLQVFVILTELAPLACARLPRFQRAGPSTSLDKSTIQGYLIVGRNISHNGKNVNFIRLDLLDLLKNPAIFALFAEQHGQSESLPEHPLHQVVLRGIVSVWRNLRVYLAIGG
jgi:hypothetical protein